MVKTALKFNCPRCLKPGEGDRWQGESGRTIETVRCENCEAEFARYQDRPWQLIKKWETYIDGGSAKIRTIG